MGKLRNDPSAVKKSRLEEVAVGGNVEDIGGDNQVGDVDDFDRFLDTIDDSSDSEDEEEEADPSQEDEEDEDNSGNDDDDEDMEPEEDEDLNEDEEESEEENESEEQENSSDDQGNEEEGEEGAPLENGVGEESSSSDVENEDEGKGGADGKGLSVKKHKMDLQKLQETDPDFYSFLKENDAELLDFNDSDEDSGSGDSDDEEALHKPPETLEEASDSEAEEERFDATSEDHKSKVQKCLKKGVVDINVIAYWESQLSGTRDINILNDVIEALKCAVQALSEGETGTELKWRVDGSANFNALLRLCIKQVKGFCVRYLCGNNAALSEKHFDQKPFDVRDKSKKKWIRLRMKIKSYMDVLVQLFKCMGNPDAVSSLLRHTLSMSGFWALLADKCFKLLRALRNIWSQGEDSCRVLAFLTIIRITMHSKDIFLVHMFKQMYIAYVANCKFTSVNTWPTINFMRSSLVELYLLDTGLAYSVAFPFVRQLAIHLRNALSPGTAPQGEGKNKKSDASRVVYSWQFVHSLHLWADVLAQSGGKEDGNLKLLVFPIVQICMGTVKLIPTRKYVPLRFHIVKMLTKLQEKAGVFIPVLPLVTEVLRLTDFSSKTASKFSVRPIDLTCCLKSDASESGYLKAVSENVFESILAYSKAIATDLAFPEIVTPTVMYLRTFLKKNCRNAEVHKKFKTLLEKMDANSKYISERRNKALEAGTVTLADTKSHKILQFQMRMNTPHPPILTYASDYFKVNQKVQVKSRKPPTETREERLIPKPQAMKHSKNKEGEEASGDNAFDKPMFKSDSEDSDGDFSTKLDAQTKKNVNKKGQKKRKIQADNDEESEEDDQAETKGKNKKKKLKKAKKAKKVPFEAIGKDVQDELVDFELSD